jgi:hypothetical protein
VAALINCRDDLGHRICEERLPIQRKITLDGLLTSVVPGLDCGRSRSYTGRCAARRRSDRRGTACLHTAQQGIAWRGILEAFKR